MSTSLLTVRDHIALTYPHEIEDSRVAEENLVRAIEKRLTAFVDEKDQELKQKDGEWHPDLW